MIAKWRKVTTGYMKCKFCSTCELVLGGKYMANVDPSSVSLPPEKGQDFGLDTCR